MNAISPRTSSFAAIRSSLVLIVLLAMLQGCGGMSATERTQAHEDSDFHYQLAIGHYQANEIPNAIRELQGALQLNPENAQALFLMGFIYHGRRDYPQAIRFYEQALEHRSEWFEVKNNLGAVYLEMREWEQAEELFRDLTRMPTYSTPGHAHNNLGWALYQQSRHQEALDQFQMAVMYQPDLCLAYNNQGLLWEELNNSREAERSYEQAIRRCNDYVEPRYRLGAMLAREGRSLPRAVEVFEQCAELSPESNYGDRCTEFLTVLQRR